MIALPIHPQFALRAATAGTSETHLRQLLPAPFNTATSPHCT